MSPSELHAHLARVSSQCCPPDTNLLPLPAHPTEVITGRQLANQTRQKQKSRVPTGPDLRSAEAHWRGMQGIQESGKLPAWPLGRSSSYLCWDPHTDMGPHHIPGSPVGPPRCLTPLTPFWHPHQQTVYFCWHSSLTYLNRTSYNSWHWPQLLHFIQLTNPVTIKTNIQSLFNNYLDFKGFPE